MSRLTRRRFVQLAAAGLGATAASGIHADFVIAGTKSSRRVLGANDTVRVAVAGIHGRGGTHIGEYANMKGVEIAYLVDPDSTLFASRVKSIEKLAGNRPQCVPDLRKALEDKHLDAVSIATPNHWHSLLTIWGCQAGKHVYVEKPCSHTIFEGRKCVEAAERYGVVVQHGTQQRSEEHQGRRNRRPPGGQVGQTAGEQGLRLQAAAEHRFQARRAGARRPSISTTGSGRPNCGPSTATWCITTGTGSGISATARSATRAYIRPTWPTGRWVPRPRCPRASGASAAAWGIEDQGQTPNMQLAVYEFGDVTVVVEVRGLVEKGHEDQRRSQLPLEGLQRVLHLRGHGPRRQVLPQGRRQGARRHGRPVHVTPGGAFGSFIACVRNHEPKAVNAPILHGHYAAALCHLANISYRLGKQVPFSQEPDGMSNPQVAESFEMIKRNLKGVGVDLDKTTYCMGRTLTIDPKTERFIGDPEADKLLTQEYRAPYVVPETV